MPIVTVADLALDTLTALSERGWCTGQPENAAGQVCLIGAINTAAYGSAEPLGNSDDYYTPAVNAVAEALWDLEITSSYESFSGSTSALFAWNDHPSRTAFQVALALVKMMDTYGNREVELSLDTMS